LITAVVSSDGEEGVNYNIGALFGAGLFVITIVLTLTIRSAPYKIHVDKNVIYRDVVFYIIGVTTVIIFAFVGTLTWWSSTIMLLEYWLLVMVVMF